MNDDDALETLAAKLNDLDLTDDEAAVFTAILLGSAEDAEVSGFADGPQAEIRGFNIGMPPTASFNLGKKHDVWTDMRPGSTSYSTWIGGS